MNSILDLKQSAKLILKRLHVYGFVHQLWSKRPDLRSFCLNLGYRVWTAPDGFPIPNARLLYAVQLSREAAWYLHSGRLCCNGIRYALSRNGYSLDDLETILDFGCGCGRIRGGRWFCRSGNPRKCTGCAGECTLEQRNRIHRQLSWPGRGVLWAAHRGGQLRTR